VLFQLGRGFAVFVRAPRPENVAASKNKKVTNGVGGNSASASKKQQVPKHGGPNIQPVYGKQGTH
jgi:hypothetical protein